MPTGALLPALRFPTSGARSALLNPLCLSPDTVLPRRTLQCASVCSSLHVCALPCADRTRRRRVVLLETAEQHCIDRMTVLYRKYRPQIFKDVVGQEHVTRTLAAAIAASRVAHAYLFSGPRGVGKTTTARLLAKAVNCEAGATKKTDVIPCNACMRCKEITAARCVDVIEIDAASHTGVDNVREHIIETARIVPAVATKKVFIIDEVHMLSTSAFSALLKTLEEPPAHVHFVLATTELHRVPDTIRSRCQHFAFRRVGAETLHARLTMLVEEEGVGVDASVLADIVRAADGCVRDAESMLGQLIALGGKTITSQDAALVLPRSSTVRVRALLDALAGSDAAAALAAVDGAEQEGCDAEAFCRDIVGALRVAARAATAKGHPVVSYVAALRLFMELLDRMSRSDHPFFLIEVAALTLLSRGAPSRAPAARTREEEQRRDGNEPPPAAGAAVIEGTPNIKATVQSSRAHKSEARRVDVLPHAPPLEHARHPEGAIVESATEALSSIQRSWYAIVRGLAEQNHAIPYLLEGGRPQRIERGTLTIGFRYKLHAEKVRTPAIGDVLAAACAAHLGAPLRIETAVISVEEFGALDAACRPQTGDMVADAALEVFGGRVVE